MEIQEVCPEIIEKIFSFLPLSDLFTMWDGSKRFQAIMAHDIRIRHLFVFHNNGFSLRSDQEFMNGIRVHAGNLDDESKIEIVEENYTDISLEGHPNILRFIRIFNRRILNFNIDCFGSTAKVCKRLFEYISKYLIKLETLNVSELEYDVMKFRKFNKIKSLFFTSCFISASLGRYI